MIVCRCLRIPAPHPNALADRVKTLIDLPQNAVVPFIYCVSEKE
jgi:hypothetical protein